MPTSKISFVCGAIASLIGLSSSAFAQSATATQTSAPSADATAETPPAAPNTAPPASPPIVAVPPGYALVPLESAGQTRYEVDYPQAVGALPPGMELPYVSGEPTPDGYRVVKESRRGLVVAGSIVGGIGWGLAITGAVADDFNHKSGALLAPVVGPWLMLAMGGAADKVTTNSYPNGSGGTYTYENREDNSSLRTMLVLDGMMQVAGAAMLTAGILFPNTRLVRKDVTVSMAPLRFGKDGYGLGAMGSF